LIAAERAVSSSAWAGGSTAEKAKQSSESKLRMSGVFTFEEIDRNVEFVGMVAPQLNSILGS